MTLFPFFIIFNTELMVTLLQGVAFCTAGTMFMVLAVFLTKFGVAPFLLILAIGSTLLMATTAGINLAMMAAVPAESRPFAVGVGTLLLHALGDVPAQPMLGALAAWFAPCLNPPDCTDRDETGLRDTLLITTSFLIIPIVLWGAGWIFIIRRTKERQDAGFYVAASIEAAKRRRTLTSERALALRPQTPESIHSPNENGYSSVPLSRYANNTRMSSAPDFSQVGNL
jgi:hypothetical protein